MSDDSARTQKTARPPRKKRQWSSPLRDTGLASGALVAGVAASASYTHMQELAAHHGQGWLAYLIPLSVDGMILAASLLIVNARRTYSETPWLAWLALVVGVLVSLAANVASALPDITSRLISAWPPVAFAAAFEIILRLVRNTDSNPAGVALVDSGDADLMARATELVEAGKATGTKVGRGTLEKELGLTEHKARQVLHQVRQGHHQPLQAVGDES